MAPHPRRASQRRGDPERARTGGRPRRPARAVRQHARGQRGHRRAGRRRVVPTRRPVPERLRRDEVAGPLRGGRADGRRRTPARHRPPGRRLRPGRPRAGGRAPLAPVPGPGPPRRPPADGVRVRARRRHRGRRRPRVRVRDARRGVRRRRPQPDADRRARARRRLTGVPAPRAVPPAVLGALARLVALVEPAVRPPAGFESESLRALAGPTYFGDDATAVRELGVEHRPLETGLGDYLAWEAARPDGGPGRLTTDRGG